VPKQKDRESKNNLDRCYKVVQQSGSGIRAIEIADQLGIDRTTVHRHLTSLDLRGKVESRGGKWFAKTAEQTIKPLEKEIVITAKIYRITLEKIRETRTIKIKGKNVDDLDLEKLGNLIQQASEKSISANFRGLFKSLKRPKHQASTSSET
jgi:DNA-binding transcriptional MocR family regulator